MPSFEMESINELPTDVRSLIEPGESFGVFINGALSPRLSSPDFAAGERVVPARGSLRLHLLFLFSGESERLEAEKYRVIIGEGANAQLTETYVGLPGARFAAKSALEIEVGAGANLQLQRLSRVGDGEVHNFAHVNAHKDAQVVISQLTLGGRSVRNEINAELLDTGARAHLLGLSLAKDKNRVDNHTFVHHRVGHTESDQIFKNLLAGQSRIDFFGRLIIAEEAQKSAAGQLNQNLILGERAEVNTTPQLEVFADDVKAAHGASVGQLDPEQVFYLMSRGIKREEAVRLLAEGFLQDIILRLPEGQRKKGQALLANAFHDFVEAEL